MPFISILSYFQQSKLQNHLVYLVFVGLTLINEFVVFALHVIRDFPFWIFFGVQDFYEYTFQYLALFCRFEFNSLKMYNLRVFKFNYVDSFFHRRFLCSKQKFPFWVYFVEVYPNLIYNYTDLILNPYWIIQKWV